jgi:hypothetical protein
MTTASHRTDTFASVLPSALRTVAVMVACDGPVVQNAVG